MKDKIKTYFEQNKETIKYYAWGVLIGGIGVGLVVKHNNTPVTIQGRWADDAKTLVDLRVTQRNGQRSYTFMPLSDLR